MVFIGNIIYRMFDPNTRCIEYVWHSSFNEILYPIYPQRKDKMPQV